MYKQLYVYILKCSDNSFYTGVTNNPEIRLKQHQNGKNPKSYTYNKRPVEMFYCKGFQNFHAAIEWEKQIKGWTRKKKIALINGEWDELKELSKCNNLTSSKNCCRASTTSQHDNNFIVPLTAKISEVESPTER